jgi:hypothetical protein
MANIKSAVAWPNGKAYLFQDETYSRYNFSTGTLEQSELSIQQNWPGLRPYRPDALVYWGFGKAYAFYGDAYVRYNLGTDGGSEGADPEYLPPNTPVKIAGNWAGLWADRVDAAVNWGNGKMYFFRDDQYMRYDITFDRVDEGYPRPLSLWGGVWPDRIDAVLYQGGRYAYFFKGEEFRRYHVVADTVDQAGHISSLVLDPVPSGISTPARNLTLADANLVMGYLIEHELLSLSETRTPYVGSWQAGISSPRPTTHVVVQPATINSVAFLYRDDTSAVLIDNVDQRMLIALYRLTRWLNASEPEVNVIRHLGIGHGSGPPNDCHNQGRALDLSGLEGQSLSASFRRSVAPDWGDRPVVAGIPLRLDPSVDRLAHNLFLTALKFGRFECECNGLGPANRWPPKEIGEVGGYVIHPDYVDAPTGPQLRPRHRDHIHMQIGPTFAPVA